MRRESGFTWSLLPRLGANESDGSGAESWKASRCLHVSRVPVTLGRLLRCRAGEDHGLPLESFIQARFLHQEPFPHHQALGGENQNRTAEFNNGCRDAAMTSSDSTDARSSSNEESWC